jgi:hypothetical protein
VHGRDGMRKLLTEDENLYGALDESVREILHMPPSKNGKHASS